MVTRTSMLFVLSLLAGCQIPIVGEWHSDRKIGNGKDNKMFLFSDGSGTADIYAAPSGLEGDPNAYVAFAFEVSWEENGTEYELDMECDEGPCDGNDFTMDCEVIRLDDGREKLDCNANKRWKGYVFNWERVQ